MCTSKETVSRKQKLLTDWENLRTKYLFDKGILSVIFKAPVELNKENPI